MDKGSKFARFFARSQEKVFDFEMTVCICFQLKMDRERQTIGMVFETS